MSSQAAGMSPGMSPAFNQWPNQDAPGPSMGSTKDENEDGVSIRPMRLKVLYTFDDQNKTNCLARGQDVLQVQTVALDETTTIGILDLKTCIEAVIQCSPELVNRLGQDFTVYAYDYSEYDNPLVGQGMLSKALAVASPAPNAPAHQSTKLITGRVCKNILGIFNNGVKETLEVKLRLVPVPTAIQGEYVNTMDKYREMSSGLPLGYDHNEWSKFLQSNPNMTQMTSRFGTPGSTCSNQRGSMNMEVVNQLLSPNLQQVPTNPFNNPDQILGNQFSSTDMIANENMALDSGTESVAGAKDTKAKKPRAAPKTTVKRPRAKRQTKGSKAAANNVGGNTSGYEEGTDGDGDDGPAPRKRAKTTQADWNTKSSFGQPTGSLRVAASTAGSLRLFRPIAMAAGNNHLEEVPRPPTPLPNMSNPQNSRPHSSLRRDSFASLPDQTRKHISPYPTLPPPASQDQIRYSIESANTSPERRSTPGLTPPEIASSPPVMGSASPTRMRSSPPCPSSPVLPQMPRTDSGFMSGSMEELFGEEEPFCPIRDESMQFVPANPPNHVSHLSPLGQEQVEDEFFIEEEVPGPMDLLPNKMPVIPPPKPKATPRVRVKPLPRSKSTMSEDGQQSLPPLKPGNLPRSHPQSTRLGSAPPSLPQAHHQPLTQQPTPQGPTHPQLNSGDVSASAVTSYRAVPTVQPRQNSRLVRTGSLGSLPAIPASDGGHSVLPPSSLHRSQTWSEAPQQVIEGDAASSHHVAGALVQQPPPPVRILPQGYQVFMPPAPKPERQVSASFQTKKIMLKQKLDEAIAKGEMPPFCSNCGAIETTTWRKSWSQERQGVPGYYDYSDEPGKVTAIVILTRDNDGRPTSYQLIKKFLAKGEDKNLFKEFVLCNPCGLWMSKYKSHRPEDRWECNKGKRPRSRPTRAKYSNGPFLTSDANFPQSEGYFPQSEGFYPQSEPAGPVDSFADGRSPNEVELPTETGPDVQVHRVELPLPPPVDHLPAIKLRPAKSKRINPMTSDAASAALRKAIRSSPARWNGVRDSSVVREQSMGAQDSPIELDGSPDPIRRILFPSPPRKDGSPRALGETSPNGVQLLSSHRRSSKNQEVDILNKENCPPAIEDQDEDAELLRMFEEELARPSTPVQDRPVPNQFKTPTRPTPSHRPITRSVSRSIRSVRLAKSPGELLRFSDRRTPSKTPTRRSPRNHESYFDSPFTATINQMMSDANNNHNLSPSHHQHQSLDQNFDFSTLPDMPNMEGSTHLGNNPETEFNLEDFFGTDMPMPSSPPRMFNLYEDPPLDWTEFNNINSPPKETEVAVKGEPAEEGLHEEEALDEVDVVQHP